MSDRSHLPRLPRLVWLRARNPHHLNISEAPFPVVVVSESEREYVGGAIIEKKRCESFSLWFKSLWEEVYAEKPEEEDEDNEDEEDTRPHRTTVRLANGVHATVEFEYEGVLYTGTVYPSEVRYD